MTQVSKRQPCFLDNSIRSWSQASDSLENSHLLGLESDMSFTGPACFKYVSTSRLYYLESTSRLWKLWEVGGPNFWEGLPAEGCTWPLVPVLLSLPLENPLWGTPTAVEDSFIHTLPSAVN